MEWLKYRPATIMGDPRYRRAAPEVRLAYLESVGDLWSAGMLGPPALPLEAVAYGGEMVAAGLAIETERGLEIPWLTAQWQGNQDFREARRQDRKRGWEEATSKVPTRELSHGDSSFLSSLSSLSSESSLPESGTPERARARGKPRPRRRVPAEWQPNDRHRELAVEHEVDLVAEVEKFRDHEYATPRTDFDAAFRTWIKRARDFAPRARAGPPAQPRKSYAEDYAAKIRRFVAGEPQDAETGEAIDITPKGAVQ